MTKWRKDTSLKKRILIFNISKDNLAKVDETKINFGQIYKYKIVATAVPRKDNISLTIIR